MALDLLHKHRLIAEGPTSSISRKNFLSIFGKTVMLPVVTSLALSSAAAASSLGVCDTTTGDNGCFAIGAPPGLPGAPGGCFCCCGTPAGDCSTCPGDCTNCFCMATYDCGGVCGTPDSNICSATSMDTLAGFACLAQGQAVNRSCRLAKLTANLAGATQYSCCQCP